MNEELDKLNDKVSKFMAEYENELDFSYVYEEYIDKTGEEEVNYVISVANTPSALQRIVILRNMMLREFDVYELIVEQVADQIADGDEYLVVDFYISKKTDFLHQQKTL